MSSPYSPSDPTGTQHPRTPPWQMRTVQTLLAILLTTQTGLIAFAFHALWPMATDANGGKITEQDLLLLVMTAGALGSTLHAIYSFCDYIGNRRFQISWFVWYLGRVPVGMAVATVLYLALRGGFTGFSGVSDLNLYGIAGIAALTGMFSRQAVTKLSEIATTIFTKLPPQPDALQNPRAVLTAVKPSTIVAGGSGVKIALEGRDFVPGMRVVVDQMLCAAAWKSATSAEVTLCDKLVDDPTTLEIAVRNPDPCPGESDPRQLTIVAAGTVLPPTDAPKAG